MAVLTKTEFCERLLRDIRKYRAAKEKVLNSLVTSYVVEAVAKSKSKTRGK